MANAVVKEARLPIEELFRLTQKESGITEQTDAYCENYNLRYAFADIWRYQVPENQVLVFKPEHRLSIRIEDDEAAPAEWGNTQEVRIEVWDTTLRKMVIIYEGLYIMSKEETDRDLMAHYEIDQPIYAPAGSWIFIRGRASVSIYTIDVSDSRFTLECSRVRPRLF